MLYARLPNEGESRATKENYDERPLRGGDITLYCQKRLTQQTTKA